MGSLVGRQVLHTLTSAASQPPCYGNSTFRREFAMQLPILQRFRQIPMAAAEISKPRHAISAKPSRTFGFIEFWKRGLRRNHLGYDNALNTQHSDNLYGISSTTFFICAHYAEKRSKILPSLSPAPDGSIASNRRRGWACPPLRTALSPNGKAQIPRAVQTGRTLAPHCSACAFSSVRLSSPCRVSPSLTID